MTRADLHKLLIEKCAELGQSVVAKALGYSPSAVSQALSGTYRGDLANLHQKVEEIYGGVIITCPILGDISLGQCAEERKKPFAATNRQRVDLFVACKKCGGKRP